MVNKKPKKTEGGYRRSRLVVGLIIAIILILLVCAVVVMDFIFSDRDPNKDLLPLEDGDYFQKAFQYAVDPIYLKNHTEYFSSNPHIAGSGYDTQTANYVYNAWKSWGLDVELQRIPVNLSYPVDRYVAIVDPPEKAFVCGLKEAVVRDGTSQNPNAIATWNGYSASGNVTGPLVYVNYGTAEDYALIQNISLNGTIVIARYGGNFRGDKVILAAARGKQKKNKTTTKK